jgi:predicted secreted protein
MKHLMVTDRDHDAEFHLRVGDELTVRLEAIPGTGYSWKISGNDEGVLSHVGEPIFERSDGQVLGGVEQQIFCFRVTSSGVSRLELEYGRPWDKPGTAMKSFSIKVIAEE